MTQVDAVGRTLLAAAGDVLSREGAGALTVRRIAHEAGVSTMNVYSRFGSKDGVVDQLYIEGFDRLRDAMAVPRTDDPLADLHAAGQAYRRFAFDHPTYYAVMFDRVVPDFEPTPDAQAHAAGTLEMLGDLVQRCIDAGLLAPGDRMHLAAALWAMCHGVVSLELRACTPPGLDWPKIYDEACARLLIGMSATQLDPPAGRPG
jgi:AcrR family transcriptional regulator